MKILLLLTLLPLCYSTLCPKGEYWSTSEVCLKCSKCKSHQTVISTCQTHKDTQCSSIKTLKHYNSLDGNYNEKNVHHFDKGKLHITNDLDNLIDNDLNYPSLELEIKHRNQHKQDDYNGDNFNQKKKRINDKFLKWDNDDDDGDYDYDNAAEEDSDDLEESYKWKKNGKHKEHKSIKGKKHSHSSEHHHYNLSPDSAEDLDNDYDYTEVLFHKTPTKNSKKKILSLYDKHKVKNDKKATAARLAKLEDERQLEEWLLQSQKQFNDRKDDLLKTLKEEQLDSYEKDKKIRLNYPLFNSDNRFKDTLKKSDIKHNNKIKTQKKHMESEVDLFKELIKNEESEEMELATLMSSKKDQSYHYRPVIPTHRMFLGEPSTYLDGNRRNTGGHIKDPQEVIKEEMMGGNIIFKKSKFTVVPIRKDHMNEDIRQVPFTAAERLVWDWQLLAIVSAVAACLLFFLVITAFLLLNARQWLQEKHHYNAESEEMSTRVALIQPNIEASITDGNKTNTFLQQFLSLGEDSIKEKNKQCN